MKKEKEMQEEINRELEELIEEYRRARETANAAIQRAHRIRGRIVWIVTNPDFNQGTDEHPLRRTSRFEIHLIQQRKITASPAKVVAWVRATFSGRKKREEMINALLSEHIRADGVKLVEKEGRNVNAFWSMITVTRTWRLKITEKKGG